MNSNATKNPSSINSTSSVVGSLALVGDSDIARWPADLMPVHNYDNDNDENNIVQVVGQSGATVEQVVPLLRQVVLDHHAIIPMTKSTTGQPPRNLVIVFCAGENDIAQGIPLEQTVMSFREIVEIMASSPPAATNHNKNNKASKKHLIVLGPKFEPWLRYDAACRKQYIKLSMAMERACQQYTKEHQHDSNNNHKITFVDCLTLFCGSSGKQPGAVLGGKAVAEPQFFDHDELHLSREGYQLWKQVVEEILLQET